MKVQTLSENLIKALSSVKESQVSICNVVVNRKPLLEALKVNKDFGLITLETGKTTWNRLSEQGEYLTDEEIQNFPCLRISLDHTVMTLLNRPIDWKSRNPAKINFNSGAEKQGIAIESQVLIRAFNYVLPYTASEETRPVLHALLFEFSNNSLNLVAADGFRLAKITLAIQGNLNTSFLIYANDIGKLMVFLKSLKPTGRGKSKTYPEVYISHTDKTVTFAADQGNISFAKVQGQFPDYQRLIPADGTEVEFMADDMLQSAKAISVMARDGSGIIRLQFKRGWDQDIQASSDFGKVVLSAKSEEMGESANEIDAKVAQDCKIALNSKYLVEALNNCKGQVIKAQVKSPSEPMLLNLPENRIYLVMPMFVQWDDKAKA